MLQGCAIRFDRVDSVFRAGEILSGRVAVKTETPSDAGHVLLHLHGECNNHWMNKTSEKVFTAKQVYLDETLLLSMSKGSTSASVPSRQLRAGPSVQEVPFCIRLQPGLPSSVTGEYGSINYTAFASFQQKSPGAPNMRQPTRETTTASDQAAEETFFVVTGLAVTQNPMWQSPVEISDTENFARFGLCCLSDDGVSATLRSAKLAFAIGVESVGAEVRIVNRSHKKVGRVCLKLMQVQKFHGQSQFLEAEDMRLTKHLVAQVEKGGVRSNAGSKFKAELQVMRNILPSQTGFAIDVEYYLVLECLPGPVLEVPIILGTT